MWTRLIFSLLATLILATPAWATEYWVTSAGAGTTTDTSYATMAAYKAACAQEAASLGSDPLFVGTADFRTRGTSPARNIGIPHGFCRGYNGNACKPDRNDAGAYQAGSGDQAATRAVRQ